MSAEPNLLLLCWYRVICKRRSRRWVVEESRDATRVCGHRVKVVFREIERECKQPEQMTGETKYLRITN